jgi:hypothetical protein
MSTSRSSLLFLVAAGLAASASAADGPTISVSGFGTAALTATNTDDAEFIRPNQASGAGNSPRSAVDSNFGVQGTFKLNDTISFTAQGLARKNGSNDNVSAELAWAFVKFKVSDDISLRAGRFALPIYMISDFRNVGYANTMIRPPAEVYRQVNSNYVEGADVLYQHSFDETTITAQAAFANGETPSPGGSYVKFKPVTSLHFVLENGPFTFRLGRADAKFSVVDNVPINGLLAQLTTLGFKDVVSLFDVTDIKGSFTSVGFMLDYQNFLVQTEYAKRKTDSRLVMNTSSGYAMFGYRYGKFTPYYYYGKIVQDSPRTVAGMPTTGPLAALTAAVNGVSKSALQSSHAIGLRWDFYKSAAFKVQVDHIVPIDGAGAFIKAKPGFTGPVNVYAAGIDFVF